jgi:hypothetical protein
MPESEQSFQDRVQKSQVLHDACNGFTPVYLPAPDTTTLASYQTKINAAGPLNNAVNGAASDLSDAITRRVEQVVLIKAATTDLIAYIKGVPAWKARYPKAKQFADAIRGFKPPRKPLPEPAPGEQPAKRNQRGGQSYAEIESNWDALVTLAIALPGFSPQNAAVGAPTISGYLSSIKALNKEVALKETILGEAQRLRQQGFYGEGGLAELFQEVKGNVKGQYGQSSTQWAQVKGMRW